MAKEQGKDKTEPDAGLKAGDAKAEGTEDTRPTCFIIMPISMPEAYKARYLDDDGHFEHVRDHIIAPAVSEAGFRPIPPVSAGAVDIRADIIKHLLTEDLVLCDMSTLNANVFFELGVRVALNKPTGLIKDKHLGRSPFDVSGINYHEYDPDLRAHIVKQTVPKMAKYVKDTWAADNKQNALWKVYGFTEAGSAPPRPEVGDQADYLGTLIDKVQAMMSRLDGRSLDIGWGPDRHAMPRDILEDDFDVTQHTMARSEVEAYMLNVLAIPVLQTAHGGDRLHVFIESRYHVPRERMVDLHRIANMFGYTGGVRVMKLEMS